MARPTPERIAGVWRGRMLRRDVPAVPSGHAILDRQLPGGGWPLGALTELLAENPGGSEFGLLLPALSALTGRGQWTVLIDPPWVPYPPALLDHGLALERLILIRTRSRDESLWACEQALQGFPGGAVLAWAEDPGFARLRRLQLAARTGRKAAFLFRPGHCAAQASPASLRLLLRPGPDGLRATLLKCQGRRPPEPLLIRPASAWIEPGAQPPAGDRDNRPVPMLPALPAAAPPQAAIRAH